MTRDILMEDYAGKIKGGMIVELVTRTSGGRETITATQILKLGEIYI